MTVAEMRMGAISAGWGSRRRVLLEQFVQRFELLYADNDLCTVWARIRADARAAGRPPIDKSRNIAENKEFYSTAGPEDREDRNLSRGTTARASNLRQAWTRETILNGPC
jgi:hypothetical protein